MGKLRKLDTIGYTIMPLAESGGDAGSQLVPPGNEHLNGTGWY
jgi:hypothetical protein